MRPPEIRARKNAHNRRVRECTTKQAVKCPQCGYGCRGTRGVKLHLTRCPSAASIVAEIATLAAVNGVHA